MPTPTDTEEFILFDQKRRANEVIERSNHLGTVPSTVIPKMGGAL
jgi:hypothetical protein